MNNSIQKIIDNKWTFVIVLVLLEVFAEVFLKQYSLNNKYYSLIIGILFYIGIAIILPGLFKKSENITIANTIWQISNVILVTLIGVLFYKDKLTRLQWLGIFLSIISVYLVANPSKN